MAHRLPLVCPTSSVLIQLAPASGLRLGVGRCMNSLADLVLEQQEAHIAACCSSASTSPPDVHSNPAKSCALRATDCCLVTLMSLTTLLRA